MTLYPDTIEYIRILNENASLYIKAALKYKETGDQRNAMNNIRSAMRYAVAAANLLMHAYTEEPFRAECFLRAASLANQCEEYMLALTLIAAGAAPSAPAETVTMMRVLQNLINIKLTERANAPVYTAPTREEAVTRFVVYRRRDGELRYALTHPNHGITWDHGSEEALFLTQEEAAMWAGHLGGIVGILSATLDDQEEIPEA
jgi:hypothetical protein